MIRAFLFFIALIVFPGISQSQDPLGRLLIGLEGGFDVQQFHDDEIPRFLPGLQIEAPIWKFALGVGLSRKFFNTYQYVYHVGLTETLIEDGNPVLYYVYDVKGFKPAYWSVPLKLTFRLHSCECVYLYAGTFLDFLDNSSPESVIYTGARSRDVLPYGVVREELMRTRTRGIELGVGFSLYTWERFRIHARPAVVFSTHPEVYGNQTQGTTLRINFGVQYGIVGRQ
jgi:hypothetical protein